MTEEDTRKIDGFKQKQNQRRQSEKTTDRLIHHGTGDRLINHPWADILDDANDALSPTDPDPPLTDYCQNE